MRGNRELRVLLLTDARETAHSEQARFVAEALGDTVGQVIARPVTARFITPDPAFGERGLEPVLADACQGGRVNFILPAEMQLDLFRKRALVDAVTWVRRACSNLDIYYDDVTACHPLLLAAMADEVFEAAGPLAVSSPRELSLVLAASGEGDPEARADAYKMMRLVWEQVGAGRGEIGFLRHDNPMLALMLHELIQTTPHLVVAMNYLWPCPHVDYIQTIVSDAGARSGRSIATTAPLAGHPNVLAWLRMRTLDMWWKFQMRTQKPAIVVAGKTKLTDDLRKPA